jgi:hypothetical protein
MRAWFCPSVVAGVHDLSPDLLPSGLYLWTNHSTRKFRDVSETYERLRRSTRRAVDQPLSGCKIVFPKHSFDLSGERPVVSFA